MRLLLAAVLLGAALPARVQTAPDSSGFAALDAEIRASVIPRDLYERQLQDAWDRAVVARQYGRADSIAVLAEAAIAETTGLPSDSISWPGLGDQLAVGLLRGDRAALDALSNDGAWREHPVVTSFPPFNLVSYDVALRRALLVRNRFVLRASTRNVLAQDSSAAVARLATNGADEEAVAVARLAIGKFLLQPTWSDGFHDAELTDAQLALNERADAFLARFPSSRFEQFVREAVRLRYRADGTLSLYLGLGTGWAGKDLGGATGYSVAGEIGLGLRSGWFHTDAGFHGTDLRVTETRTVGDESVVEGDRLTIGLLGVDVGLRVPIGGLDVLPYLSGGLLLQGTSGANANEPERSTYEPPNRLGGGYGVALEYLGDRSLRHGGTAVRARIGRLIPQFSDGFEDALDGPVTYASFGLTLSGVSRTRLY